jgi:hypothetical protein
MQVRVVVLDKDDNNPRFLESNLTLGVRVNAPIYTELAKVTSLVVYSADIRQGWDLS